MIQLRALSRSVVVVVIAGVVGLAVLVGLSLAADTGDGRAQTTSRHYRSQAVSEQEPVVRRVHLPNASKNADLIGDLQYPPEQRTPVVAHQGVSMTIVYQAGPYAAAVAADGTYVYAGFDSKFSILDVTDPAHPAEIGAHPTTKAVTQIAVSDGYAYLRDAGGQLRVLDIRDAASPVELASLTLPITRVYDIAIAGGHLYVAEVRPWDTAAGLRVFDVTDPASPSEARLLPEPEYDVVDLKSDGQWLYAAQSFWGGYGAMTVFDLADPLEPNGVGAFVPVEAAVWEVDAAGQYVYAGLGEAVTEDDQARLVVIDVSQPMEPTPLGEYTYPKYSTTGEPPVFNGLAAHGDNEVVTAEAHLREFGRDRLFDHYVRLLDVSDRSDPQSVASVEVPPRPMEIAAMADHIYVAAGDSGLLVIEIQRQ